MYEELGDTADDAELVVSELITNCLNAGARMLDLTLVGHHATVRIEATDDAAGLPEIGTLADPDEVTGRGLRIIDTPQRRLGHTAHDRRKDRLGGSHRPKSATPAVRLRGAARPVAKLRVAGCSPRDRAVIGFVI
jgi:hypothetical protein